MMSAELTAAFGPPSSQFSWLGVILAMAIGLGLGIFILLDHWPAAREFLGQFGLAIWHGLFLALVIAGLPLLPAFLLAPRLKTVPGLLYVAFFLVELTLLGVVSWRVRKARAERRRLLAP